jgi:hypothetical protein
MPNRIPIVKERKENEQLEDKFRSSHDKAYIVTEIYM